MRYMMINRGRTHLSEFRFLASPDALAEAAVNVPGFVR